MAANSRFSFAELNALYNSGMIGVGNEYDSLVQLRTNHTDTQVNPLTHSNAKLHPVWAE